MGMMNEEREKHIRIASMLIGAIHDLIRPMLMCQIEKDVAKEALENYIKMLEQQPCEDCISREYLIDKIGSVDGLEGVENSNFFAKYYMDIVKSAPSVTPSRPKGHWILIHPLQEDDDGAYICSNCEHGDWDCDTSYKYCPFCGADMRESEDSK